MSEEAIANCFRKTNISHANQQTSVTDACNPFKSLEEELDNLRKLDQKAVQDNLSAESFIGLDSEVVTSASYMSDADILTEVIPDSIEDQDHDVIEDLDFLPPLTRPSKSDVEEALDKLQGIFLFSSCGNEIRSLLFKIDFFEQGMNRKLKAKSCNIFFSSSVNLDYLINKDNKKDNNFLFLLF